MERPQNITRGTKISVMLIVLFHLVGLIGLSVTSLRPLFLQIVSWHLLLMLAIIVFNHQFFDARFIIFVSLIAITGYGAEWVGIHTGQLFGSYYYGKTLGIKISEVPLIISINWFLLIYSTGVLLQRSRLKNKFVRVIAGAIILVLLDVLIEPVAIRLDYWHWASAVIPVKNYVCWFLLSGLMLFVFEKFRFEKQSIVTPALLLTQVLFFVSLFIALNL
jgi:putative membrane protein